MFASFVRLIVAVCQTDCCWLCYTGLCGLCYSPGFYQIDSFFTAPGRYCINCVWVLSCFYPAQFESSKMLKTYFYCRFWGLSRHCHNGVLFFPPCPNPINHGRQRTRGRRGTADPSYETQRAQLHRGARHGGQVTSGRLNSCHLTCMAHAFVEPQAPGQMERWRTKWQALAVSTWHGRPRQTDSQVGGIRPASWQPPSRRHLHPWQLSPGAEICLPLSLCHAPAVDAFTCQVTWRLPWFIYYYCLMSTW